MSTQSLNLIKTALATGTKAKNEKSAIWRTLTELAEKQNISVQQLSEDVTHILANIASTASEGAPLKLMHLDSVAAFMAGVEAIANALPNSQDVGKVQNTLRYLRAAKIGADGFITTASAPIAQVGVRNSELMSKYNKLVKDYAVGASGGHPSGDQLAAAAKQLQYRIDQAMRAAVSGIQASPAATSPSSVGTMPSHL